MNFADCGHQAPLVSIATGTKECVAAIAKYFFALLTGALSTAAKADVDVN